MKYVFTAVLILAAMQLSAQAAVTLYNPAADAAKDIAAAVRKAKAERKNVLVEAGGNWCSWCIEFNRFCDSNAQVDSLLKADFVMYRLNYSKENKNLSTLAKYGYPQRFGFPVFIVLDGNGTRIHTQNSVYLEQGRSYHKGKVIEFLEQWNRRALDPSSYNNY